MPITVSRELISATATTAAPACENVRFQPRENQLLGGSSFIGSGLISFSMRLFIRHQSACEFGGTISVGTLSWHVARINEKSSYNFAHSRHNSRCVPIV